MPPAHPPVAGFCLILARQLHGDDALAFPSVIYVVLFAVRGDYFQIKEVPKRAGDAEIRSVRIHHPYMIGCSKCDFFIQVAFLSKQTPDDLLNLPYRDHLYIIPGEIQLFPVVPRNIKGLKTQFFRFGYALLHPVYCSYFA